MRLHQVLTGSCNDSDQCLSCGSIRNLPFIAYASGCDLVILDNEFTRVQVIAGVTTGNVEITCVGCCQRTGKIAVSYGSKVCIYEPEEISFKGDNGLDLSGEPLPSDVNVECVDEGAGGCSPSSSCASLGFRWSRSVVLEARSGVLDLAWSPLGEDLLTCGEWLQLWQPPVLRPDFVVGGAAETGEAEGGHVEDAMCPVWVVDWEKRYISTNTKGPANRIAFSSDGLQFATMSEGDSQVLVWYWDRFYKPFSAANASRKGSTAGCHLGDVECSRYASLVLSHPAPVTGFYWRKTSRYMPDGSVANVLLTSCKDQVCRIWCESRLADRRGLNPTQGDPSLALETPSPNTNTNNIRTSFINQINRIRNMGFNDPDLDRTPPVRRNNSSTAQQSSGLGESSQSSSATLSSFCLPHHGSLYPHFCLAATISARHDIPLPPSVSARGPRGKPADFVLHWLNNKEMQFTTDTQRLVQEIARRATSGDNVDDREAPPTGSSGTGGSAPANPPGQSQTSGSRLTPWMSQQLAHLDRELDMMLADWRRSPDVLFTIHPVDGSLLVWLVHWLDESQSGGSDGVCRLRHVQVSVHSRLPEAFPIGDASSMSPNLLVYSPGKQACAASMLAAVIEAQEKDMVLPDNSGSEDGTEENADRSRPTTQTSGNTQSGMDSLRAWLAKNSPSYTTGSGGSNTISGQRPVMLVSKHENGSLNQWELAVAENSKFESVLSVSQLGRISGHRFHTNSAVCHPTLPLLLTTSHHNTPVAAGLKTSPAESTDVSASSGDSELILWKVESVGPLSKAGGITELARVNSPQQTAFSCVAWFPTLLPSSVLGIQSKSPAALFTGMAATHKLILYLTVIDARSIVGDTETPSFSNQSNPLVREMSTSSSNKESFPRRGSEYRVVSLQSTARPGCIVELEDISEGGPDEVGRNTLLLHVFGEEMITGRRTMKQQDDDPAAFLTTAGDPDASTHSSRGATSQQQDARSGGGGEFAEDFYVVRLDRRSHETLLMMWRVSVRARPPRVPTSGGATKETFILNEYDSDEEVERKPGSRKSSRQQRRESQQSQEPLQDLTISITSVKVCEQPLPLPPRVEVLRATVAAAHLSSASIYPACFAPYLLSTACSDATVRFWKYGPSKIGDSTTFEWSEWQMLLTNHLSSSIQLPTEAQPISLSCAYSGRVAVAFRVPSTSVTSSSNAAPIGRKHKATKESSEDSEGLVDLRVAIYECESTGGSEWLLEDTIELNNVKIPSIVLNKLDWQQQRCLEHNQSPSIIASNANVHQLLHQHSGSLRQSSFDDDGAPGAHRQSFSMRAQELAERRPSAGHHQSLAANVIVDLTEPAAGLQAALNKTGGGGPGMRSLLLKPKHIIQLDWVSTEDGSHLLSVAVGTQILVYAAVCRDIVMATTRSRQTLMTSSMEDIRWMKLRMIQLETADDLPPFPMHTSWVREGLMVVGLDNELHVYSQWKSHTLEPLAVTSSGESSVDLPDKTTSVDPMVPIMKGRGEAMSKTESKSSLVASTECDRRSLMDQSLALPSASSMSMARLTKTYSAYRMSASPSVSKQLTSKDPVAAFGAAKSANQGIKHQTSLEGLSLNFIKDIGLFEAVQVCNPVLPQYHPRQLIEWMNFGKLRRVRAILTHLMRCVAGWDNTGERGSPRTKRKDDNSEGFRVRLSSSVSSGGAGGGGNQAGKDTDIRAIPPLPLYALLAVDQLETTSAAGPDQPDNLHELDLLGEPDDITIDLGDDYQDEEDDVVEDTLEVGGGVPQMRRSRRRRQASYASSTGGGGHLTGIAGLLNFTPEHANKLSERLMRTQLPGLSALDQMYLLAIAELMANMRTDVTERLSGFASASSAQLPSSGGTTAVPSGGPADRGNLSVRARGKRGDLVRMNTMGEGTGGYVAPEGSLMGTTDSLDDCGLRFLLTMEHYSYMLRTLPMKQRNLLITYGLDSSHLVWAFHSEAEQELLSRVPGMSRDELTWREFRQYGCGWWVRNTNTLKRCVEKIAKNAFQKSKDPMDAAIFYLAMRKIKIIAALFKNSEHRTLEAFFRNDFSQPGPCRKAKVNAFALLSKHRYEHAAALFLLAGAVKDAVLVCLDNLKDLQLAMVIARLYEGELGASQDTTGHHTLNQILTEHVVNHVDPFYRSMAFWTLGQQSRALETLLDSPSSSGHDYTVDDEVDSYSASKHNVFNFYTFLRAHPLLNRLRLIARGGEEAAAAAATCGISSMERRLFFRTAHMYFQIGCPSLALEVLSKLPEVMFTDEQLQQAAEQHTAGLATVVKQVSVTAEMDSQALDTGLFSWDALEPGTAVSLGGAAGEDEFKIQWSDDSEPEEELDGGDAVPSVAKESVQDAGLPDGGVQPRTGTVDIMAHQLKFIACLKIISEELSTLATGIEPDGGHLRFHFYIWLEREVEVLQQLCNYNLDLETDPLPPGESGVARKRNSSSAALMTGGSSDPMTTSGLALCPSPTNTEVISRHNSTHVKHRRGSVLCADELLSGPKNTAISEEELVAKIQRLDKRKRWLQSHQSLLRSLMSFCSLQGASGVGLASVRMELLLLLQELQINTTTKLHAPLPPPTNVPLIGAALSPAKTFIANPIQHLKCLIRDIVDNLTSIPCPYTAPNLGDVTGRRRPVTQTIPDASAKVVASTRQQQLTQQRLLEQSCLTADQEKEILLLRNLSTALSACILQSLSDSDSVMVKQASLEISGIEGFTRHYVGYQLIHAEGGHDNRARRKSGTPTDQTKVTSEPSKWPGTSILTGLLRRRSDEDTPNLCQLLCESLCSVYLGLLYYGLHTSDSSLLYRLCQTRLDRVLWARVFGGALRKRPAPPSTPPERPPPPSPRAGVKNDYQSSNSDSDDDDRGSATIIGRPGGVASSSQAATKDRAMSALHVASQQGRPSDYMASSRANIINKVAPPRPQQPLVEERFISPQTSIVDCLLEKLDVDPTSPDFVYDSDSADSPAGYNDLATAQSDSLYAEEGGYDSDDDAYDDLGEEGSGAFHMADIQWADPTSYAWCLMRYAVTVRALDQVTGLIQMLDFESPELAVTCPYLFRSIKRLRQCVRFYKATLDWTEGPPAKFGPVGAAGFDTTQATSTSDASNRAMTRFKALLDSKKSPFETRNPLSLPVKRLWCALVKQECLQELFMRYVYRKPKSELGDISKMRGAGVSSRLTRNPADVSNVAPGDVMKVIHKEQEAIMGLCVNQANLNCIAMASNKELVELDISNLLNPPIWLEDEIEYDIEVIRNPPPASTGRDNDDFVLVVERPPLQSSMHQPPTAPGVLPAPREPQYNNPGHSGNVFRGFHLPGSSQQHNLSPLALDRSRRMLKTMTKRFIPGIQQMAAHPSLPYYLCGGSNGQLHLFEWDHAAPIIPPFNSPCHRGKISALRFDDTGRKFGVGDSDGMFALWHFSVSPSVQPPYFSYRCHSRGVRDFAFLNSTSVFASAGMSGPASTQGPSVSASGENTEATLAVWDTLMPPGRAAVQQYSDSVLDAGCTSLCPAVRHQVLVAGTKRGEIVLVDLRQAAVRHSFLAHEAAVTTILIDPLQEFFITGSADGNIKVWRLGEHELIASYRGEHMTKSALFRHSDVGITQLHLFPDNRLLSCGADGAIKLRQLDPDLLFKPAGSPRK